MKKTFTFGCIFLYSICLLKPFLPFIAYNLNKQYISTTLCENIAKPEMHCEGKCYLEKEIQKESTTDQKANTSETKIPLFQNVNEHDLSLCSLISPEVVKCIASNTREFKIISSPYSQNIYTPPRLV